MSEQAEVRQQKAQEQGHSEGMNEQEAVRQQPAQQQGQSGLAPSTGHFSVYGVFRVATAVQQSMTELNGAVSSKEEKIVVITKIVIKLINLTDH